MSIRSGRLLALALAGALGASPGSGQISPPPTASVSVSPTPTPSPTLVETPPATPTPPSIPPSRITALPSISVMVLPPENPFGLVTDAPAAPPTRPPLPDLRLPAALFVSTRLDPQGSVSAVRRNRDPIPSLKAETEKSLARWTFQPARRAGQPVETWAPMRIDLEVFVEGPKVERLTLAPVTPETPLPTPFPWPDDALWLEGKTAAPSDGAVPAEQLEMVATPKKTPWSAGSYRGAFSARFWIKVSAAGRAERMIPIEVTDPILLPYFKQATAGWVFRPAQKGGAPTDSWSELAVGGQVEYSVKIKQIAALRRTLPEP